MVKDKLEIESTINIEEQGHALLPAYFLALRLKNVRSFGPEQTLDLSNGAGRPAQWTIILGNNGVGKTTLLQSLVAVTPTREVNYVAPRCTNPLRFEWPLYRSGEREYELSADFLVDTKLSKSGGRKIVDFDVERARTGSVSAAASPRVITEFTCLGYGASRRMGETSLSEKGADDPFASLFSDNVELLNAEEWLLQADYAARAGSNVATRKRAAKRRDEIKDILINLLPDVDDIKFAQITEEQPKPRVEVKTPYGWVSIKALSLGYKTLIAWMVDLASRMFDRYPDSPNPLAEPAVVLIDEIDLHLHPKWQRTLMSYLSERFPNTQFIATAHSPLVVQAASDANVVLLRREGDHVVIDNNMKDIHGWRVDQILTSDLFGLESARPPQLDPLLMGNARPKPERLAEKLLQIRNALGLSQPQIHNRLGVEDLIEYNEVSKYELGKREPPLKILLQYARLAGVYMEDIADDELDLPEKLPGNVRYEGIKRKHTIRGKSKR